MDKKEKLSKIGEKQPIDPKDKNYREYKYKLPSGFIATKKYVLKKNINKDELYTDFKEGMSKSEICLKYDITFPTLRKYLANYKTKAEQLGGPSELRNGNK